MESKTLGKSVEIPVDVEGIIKDLDTIRKERTGKTEEIKHCDLLEKYKLIEKEPRTKFEFGSEPTLRGAEARDVFESLNDTDQEEIKKSVAKSRNIMEEFAESALEAFKETQRTGSTSAFKKLSQDEQEEILRELKIVRELTQKDLPTPKNDKEKEFLNIVLKMFYTYRAKNTDYGSSFDELFDEFGMTSALLRLKDKYNRLKAITANGDIKVKDESIQDTLMDLANYAILTLLKLRE
jgi:hypothetical protein